MVAGRLSAGFKYKVAGRLSAGARWMPAKRCSRTRRGLTLRCKSVLALSIAAAARRTPSGLARSAQAAI